MRKFKTMLWAMLPLLALAFAVGCEKGPNEEGGTDGPEFKKDSVIKLGKTTINVGVGGGSQLLEYTIENPHQGEKISAEAAADWVNGFNYGITGALQFNVDANDGTEPRECLVTVKYRFAEDVVFTVKQGARTNAGFKLENVSSDLFSYTVDVIPDDKTAPYIIMSADATYIAQSGFETPEDYYEDDFFYFGWLGQFYGMDAIGIMQERSRVGDQRGITIGDGVSGVPCTFYCYYFDWTTGALISDIAMFEIVTKEPEKIAVEFNVDYTVEGPLVKADVTPESYEGAYYFDMLNGLLVDSYLETFDFLNNDPAEAAEYYWSNAVSNMSNDMSYDQIVAFYNCQGNYEDGTPRSHYEFELLANHDYYLFAFAMEEHGLPASKPQIVKITTGDVEPSDNVITTSVTDVTAQSATINFTTTNDDYYIAGWEKASDWATFGNNDAERQEYLLTNRSYELISGNYSQGIIGLEAETDYVLYAFGSRGGKATTDYIATTTFKTRKISGGLASVEFVDLGFFSASDIAEVPGFEFCAGTSYSGKFILPIEAKITGEYTGFFWTVWDWTGRNDMYTDQQYRDNLVWSINEYGSMSTDKTYTILDNDSYYELVALVVDQYGDFSDVAKLCVSTSYANANTDIEALDEWWNGGNDGPDLQSLVIDREPKQLFKNKIKGMKASEMTFERERKVVEMDEISATR
ncbi:MAG: hypothetical protein E7135_00260 [Rikenellaceae bacterium]|nr:hypothetical protein [Rikenellaceae bacterium]